MKTYSFFVYDLFIPVFSYDAEEGEMGVLTSQEAIVERLLHLDYELKQLGTRGDPLVLVIFGGAAVLLLAGDVRFTRDIDALIDGCPTRKELDLLEKYGVNDRLSIGVTPEDYTKRMRELKIGTECIKAYVAGPIDVIVHKLLNRGDSRDIEDAMVLMDQLKEHEFEQLRTLFWEYRKYTIGDERRSCDIDDVIERYQHRKKGMTG